MSWDTAEAHTNDTEIIAGVDVEYNIHKWWYLRERLLLIHHQSLWTEYEYQFYALKLSLKQALLWVNQKMMMLVVVVIVWQKM